MSLFQKCLIALILSGFSNLKDTKGQSMPLSTSSDSALYYYKRGWQEIMDFGDYSSSEIMYRKSVAHDPNFLIGLSLVGRISRDAGERDEILEIIDKNLGEINGDERKLLDVYVNLIRLTNKRESGDSINLALFRKKTLDSAYVSLSRLVKKYPDEIYYKAEYIEVVHYIYGARRALDVIQETISGEQLENPFIMSYMSLLEAKEENFELSYQHARRLESIVSSDVPKIWVTWANYYVEKEDYLHATRMTDQALLRDPGNIDAQRLKKALEKLVDSNED